MMILEPISTHMFNQLLELPHSGRGTRHGLKVLKDDHMKHKSFRIHPKNPMSLENIAFAGAIYINARNTIKINERCEKDTLFLKIKTYLND